VAGEPLVREARPGDARAIAEVSVASRRWSYRDHFAEADLEALSVNDTTANVAEGLAELPPGAAVFVADARLPDDQIHGSAPGDLVGDVDPFRGLGVPNLRHIHISSLPTQVPPVGNASE